LKKLVLTPPAYEKQRSVILSSSLTAFIKH